MRQPDRKLTALADLLAAESLSAAELLHLASLVELTEFPAGAVVAPAGLPSGWCTKVLAGRLASTVPLEEHPAGSVVVHRPSSALVALTDVVLLTVAEADLPLLGRITPRLLTATPAKEHS